MSERSVTFGHQKSAREHEYRTESDEAGLSGAAASLVSASPHHHSVHARSSAAQQPRAVAPSERQQKEGHVEQVEEDVNGEGRYLAGKGLS